MKLKGLKPLPFPEEPRTLGEHLRRRRLQLGLFQRNAAVRLGVTLNTILDWEKDRQQPEDRHWPKVIAFLGYDPFPEPKTLPEKLRAKRRSLGLARKKLAQVSGVDEGTLKHWEEGTRVPHGHLLAWVTEFLASDEPPSVLPLRRKLRRSARRLTAAQVVGS